MLVKISYGWQQKQTKNSQTEGAADKDSALPVTG